MKYIFLIYFCLSFRNLSFAQNFTIGPKVGYGFYQISTKAQIDKYLIQSDNYAEESNHLGLYGHFSFVGNKFYIQPEFYYSFYKVDNFYLLNTNPNDIFIEVEGEFYKWHDWTVIQLHIPEKAFEMPIKLGVKLWKPLKLLELKVFAGLVIEYRLPDKSANEYFNNRNYSLPQVAQYMILKDVYKSFRRFNFAYTAGLGLDIWKITFDVQYSGSLRSMTNPVRFNERTYPFHVKWAHLLFSLGGKIEFGKKKHLQNN